MIAIRRPFAAFLLAGLTSLPPCANAGMVLTQPATVVRLESYTDFASGDVVFTINLTVAGCTGFWLQPTDAGFKQTYAALMMAKAAQLNVVVYAYDDQLWPGGGSSVPYCKVRSLTAQ
jgi:hypothetical protein